MHIYYAKTETEMTKTFERIECLLAKQFELTKHDIYVNIKNMEADLRMECK